MVTDHKDQLRQKKMGNKKVLHIMRFLFIV